MRKFGFELEFSGSRIALTRSDLFSDLREAARQQGHTASETENSQHWTLKTDHCGYEFTSPALQATENNFQKAWDIIRKLQITCHENRQIDMPAHQNVCHPSCGLHVHLEIGDLNESQIANMINIFRTFEDSLLAIHPPSRRNNSFVRLLSSRRSTNWDFRALRDHNLAVNFGRYSRTSARRQTIEIRYAGATIRPRKVINWIQILICMVEASKRVINFPYIPNRTFEDFKSFIRNSETETWLDARRPILTRWMDRRINQLSVYHEARETRRELRNIA